MNDYSILINTCDKFEDCWDPFFKLFSIYWPDYNGTIYLNTEYKDYSYGSLKIVALKVAAGVDKFVRLTWSECLIRALNKIDSSVVLYMQEDYFLKDNVKNDLVNKYVNMMKENSKIHCIHLTDQAVKAGKQSSELDGLYPVIVKQRYRICCQAALWQKNTLLNYLKPYESAWQFEEFGSERSVYLNHNFFVVDSNWVQLDKFEIIPYIFTGIIQGQWYKEIVPLFANNNIEMDYTKRGFFNAVQPRPISLKVKNQMKRIPVLFKHKVDLVRLMTKKMIS